MALNLNNDDFTLAAMGGVGDEQKKQVKISNRVAELEKEVRIIPDKDKQQKLKEVVQKKALLQQMKNTIDALLLRLDKMTEINNKEQIPSNNKINNDDGKSSLVNSEGPNKTKEKNNKGIIDNKDKQCQEHFKKVKRYVYINEDASKFR